MMLALLGATALGCASEVQSCDLATDEMVMWATLTDSDGEIEIEIEFEVANAEGAALALCPERDHLTVNGTEASLVRALGQLYYAVEFESASEGSYEIVLERDGAQSVAVEIEMPPIFELTAPEPDSTHSRGAALEVVWAPAWPGGTMKLAIEDAIGSDCIEGLGVEYEVEDQGSFSVAGNALVGGGAGSCGVSLALSRSVAIEYPAAFHEGGQISAFVRRRRPFTSVE